MMITIGSGFERKAGGDSRYFVPSLSDLGLSEWAERDRERGSV